MGGINGAVAKMYSEMAGRHRAQPGTIQIINTAMIPASKCRREAVQEMHNSTLKFPVIRKMPLVSKKLRTTFKAKPHDLCALSALMVRAMICTGSGQLTGFSVSSAGAIECELSPSLSDLVSE